MSYEELKEFLNSSKDIKTVRNIAIELLDGNNWKDVYDAYETEIKRKFKMKAEFLKQVTESHKTFRLPKPFAEKWLEALRSGEYIQYRGTLVNHSFDEEGNIGWCSNVEACCLGVAALMSGAEPLDLAGEEIPSDLNRELLSVLEYPDELLENSMCENFDFSNILAILNDGMTDTNFKKIKGLYPNIIFHKDKFELDSDTLTSKLTYSFEDIAKFVEDNTEFYEVEAKTQN